MQLIRYEAACAAIAMAVSIDDVKEITNRAEAARAYARQAKNRQLELDALEIRVRAERRLGEIVIVLKEQNQIRVGGPGRGHQGERPPVTLKELGVDSNMSGGAQRLAKLTESRFAEELSQWRSKSERSQRIEVPLQHYRIPSIRGDRQKAAVRKGRSIIESGDLFARFVAGDGRRIADWREGELDRIRQVAERTIACVDALRANLPVANPEPLDTMEMIFRDGAALAKILTEVWDGVTITPGRAGVDDARIAASKEKRSRVCKACGSKFILKRAPHANRPTEGLYCSRKCSHSVARKTH